MSLLGLQTGVAKIIRAQGYSQTTDGSDLDVDQLIAELDLTDSEISILQQLSREKELQKYGQELSWTRWQTVEKNLLRVRQFVASDILYDLWLYAYEPTALRVTSDNEGRAQFTRGFLRFLREDAQAIDVLARLEIPFLDDVIAFEEAEIRLATAVADPELSDVAAGSGGQVSLSLTLRYDIPAILAAVTSRDPADVINEAPRLARNFSLVMLRQGPGRLPRLYEVIDD